MAAPVHSPLTEVTAPQRETDALPILNDSCAFATSCRLQLVHSGHSVTATLRSATASGLVLRIAKDDHSDELYPHALCCVAFPYRTSLCAFLGCLLEIRNSDETGREVVVAVPQRLVVTNLRKSFRVPVVSDSELLVILKLADQPSWNVTAGNIAETGIEVDFPTDRDVPTLPLGTVVEVELHFRQEQLRLTASVRRQKGPQCGLLFVAATGAEAQHQTERLHGIVLSLQQLWLKSRLQ